MARAEQQYAAILCFGQAAAKPNRKNKKNCTIDDNEINVFFR